VILKVFFKIYRWSLKAANRIKLSYYKHLWKDQLNFDKSFLFSRYSTIEMLSGTSAATFKKGVHFRNYCSIICSDNGRLQLGEHVFFNNYCSINCLYEITVGDNTIFGEGVRLYDHNHEFSDKEKLITGQGMKYGAITIGDNCWIGSNTVILPNVTIGDNVVIGANNLVYKSIPANTVVMAMSEKYLKAR
jgi:acetyltransferase-like isoleucine patch superfamily enzyme